MACAQWAFGFPITKKSTRETASWLEGMAGIARVLHHGLESHPDH